jgi:hypothetical protein
MGPTFCSWSDEDDEHEMHVLDDGDVCLSDRRTFISCDCSDEVRNVPIDVAF